MNEALPDIARIGARWRVADDFELRLFGSYTRWSVNQTQWQKSRFQGYACATYADGSDASGGTISNFRRNWKRHLRHPGRGELLDEASRSSSSPERATRTRRRPTARCSEPSTADADNVQLSAGARLFVAHWFYVGASYTQFLFFDRDNTGKSTLADATVPTQQQDGGGKYTQWIGLFDLNVEKRF